MAQNWGENDKIVNVGSADFGADDEVVQDGALSRGWNNAKKSIAMTAQLATGDTAGAAQTVKEAAEYARANPGTKEGAALSEAWGKGDGVLGGTGNVIEKIGSDYREAKGFVPGLKSVGRNIKALGAGVVEQVPNMIAPTLGLAGGALAGGSAGSAAPIVGNAAGALMGGWAGASAGNALVEGGDQIQTAIQKAGINPTDTKAVQAYLDQNSGELLKNTAIKGAVIGAVDTATGGLSHFLLAGAGKAAAGRALREMGVDLADKAAVKAAQQSGEFARLIAADTAYQASKKGAGNVARNVAAAGLEPAGEFAGEYLGSGLANDNWDTKGAALEALSSIGQSGAMFAGQKAWQYAASPKSSEAGATASDTPSAPQAESRPGPMLALPPPVINVDSQGNAITAEDRNAQTQFQRENLAARMQRINSGDIIDVTPINSAPERQTESQAMGIDPNAGALSSAAALAVDSGAHAQSIQESVQALSGEVADKEAKQGSNTEPAAEPVTQDRVSEIQDRLDFIQQQASSTGWNKEMVAQRNQLRDEMGRLQQQNASESSIPKAATSEAQKTAQQTAQQPSLTPIESAAGADIKSIVAKQIPQMNDAELQQAINYYGPDHKRTQKLQKELSKRTSVSNATTGAANAQAAEAQQASPQPSQAAGEAPSAAVQAVAQSALGTARAEAAGSAVPQSSGLTGASGTLNTGAKSASAETPVTPTTQVAAAPVVQGAKASTPAASVTPEQIKAAGDRWQTMTTVERTALSGQIEAKPIIKKNLPRASFGDLNVDLQNKLTQAMQPRDQLTYEKAKADADAARVRSKAAGEALNAYPKLPNGLTPDEVKASPEWLAAKRESDNALNAERAANSVVVKNFPKENSADIKAERERRATESLETSARQKALESKTSQEPKASSSKAPGAPVAEKTGADQETQPAAPAPVKKAPRGVLAKKAEAEENRSAGPNSRTNGTAEREAANTKNEAANKAEKDEETEVHGARIYKTGLRQPDGSIAPRWAAQNRDNIGTNKVFGDTLHVSREEAVAQAERDYQREQDKAEINRRLAEDAAKREAEKEANRGKSIAQRKADSVLDKPTSLPREAGLGAGTLRESIEAAIQQGRPIVERPVFDSAAKTRDQKTIEDVRRRGYILGLSNENLPLVKAGLEANTRLKENNYTKPEYCIYRGSKPEGAFDTISKTAFAYAQTLEKPQAHSSTGNENDFATKREPAAERAGVTGDAAAHEAATSPKNDLPEPTQAQKEAGNYANGHINVQGLDVTVENPRGVLAKKAAIEKEKAAESNARQITEASSGKASGESVAENVAVDQESNVSQNAPGIDTSAGSVDAIAKPQATAQQEAGRTKKLPPFPVDGYRLERYYANGAKVKPLPAKAFSPAEVQAITDWFKSIGWSVTSGSGSNGVNATNDVGMTVDDLPEPYTAAQRRKDEAQKAADERAAGKQNAQDDYLASTDAGKFVSDMFGDAMNRFNLTALAKVLAGEEKTFGGLFSNRAADVLADAGIATEWRQVKDVVADIKVKFDAAQQEAQHQDPGQPAEAVTPAVVAKSDAETTVADQEGKAERPSTYGANNKQETGSQDSSDQFARAPDGSIDFGEITAEQGRKIRRQAGKIRLTQGVQNNDGTGYGLAHIEANHGKQIRNAGFASVQDFVSHVAKDFGEVWQSEGRQLLVAYRGDAQHMMYVQLEPAQDKGGDYYRVNTAFPVRQSDYPERHDFVKLWDGSEPASTASGEQSAFAGQPASKSGQATPNAGGQSDSNLAQARPESSTEEANKPPDEFPLKEAASSYSGISHSGTQRARADAQEYEQFIEAERTKAEAAAETDEQKAALSEALGSLRADYLSAYGRLMNVRAGTYSGHVAGRSGLNAKQAGVRNDSLTRAMTQFSEWKKGATGRVKKAVLKARTEAQREADAAALQQSQDDKAERKQKSDMDLMRKILSWKKGDQVPIGKSAIVAGVNLSRDGYPSSVKLQPINGEALSDDKFDLAALYRTKGMSVPESKRRVRELADAVRAEDSSASQETGVTSAQTDPASKTPILDSHVATMDAIHAGTATAEQLKESFARVQEQRDAIKAELATQTKDQLLRAGGSTFAMRNRDSKKAEIVEAMVNVISNEYALGRRYGASSYVMSAAGLAEHRKAQDAALRELVANTTDEDIKAYAKEIEQSMAEAKSRREANAKAISDPQTLSDFRAALNHYIQTNGETRQQAYLRLTPEQRQRYDDLEAEQSKAAREERKNAIRSQGVRAAGQATVGSVIATKHTKLGHDLFVVQLADRVSREDYDTLNASAKSLGGNYSSYRGNGAVPGFQFRTRESADAFSKLVAGDTEDARSVAQARRDAFADDRSQTGAERLRTMAEALNERADASLNQERKTNTARRASMANSAEAAARADKALAGTMANLAGAIESGSTKYLDAVRQKVQVEYLSATLRTAKDEQLRQKYPDYGDYLKHRGEAIDGETVDFAKYPNFTAMRSDLADLGRKLLEIDGTKKLGQRLMSVADDVTDAYTDWAKAHLLHVSQFGRAGQLADFASRDAAEHAIRRSGLTGRAIVLPIKRGENRVILSPSEAMRMGLWEGDGDKRITLTGEFGKELVDTVGRRANGAVSIPWALESAAEGRKRLEGMGIYTPSEFRAALREFAGLQEAQATPDKIKQMERAMIGRRNDGLDFFPTSENVVNSMLDAAEITEGMSVLEPSAGMAHIADVIREKAGVDPDVAELSADRRELLDAKGYNIVGSDFMAMNDRGFTYGDVFRHEDGRVGVMAKSGGLGSGRVGLAPLDEAGHPDMRRIEWVDRDALTGIEKRGSNSGYDRIIMNPPFSKGRDIEHVKHAFSLLRPGGRLVAIMGEGAFFQSNKAAESFRSWLDELGATSEKLPEGSFLDPSLPVNTGVNARMVVIDKPATITIDGKERPTTNGNGNFDPNEQRILLSKGEATPSSVSQVKAEITGAIGRPLNRAIRVVQSVNDLPAFARNEVRQAGAEHDMQGAFFPDTGEVFLVADNIAPGEAMAVLIHEAGVHKGLRSLIGDAGMKTLANQIRAWATIVRNGEHGDLARRALSRVPDDTSVQNRDEELIAYFVAEATKAGHGEPRPKSGETAISRWFARLWGMVREAIEKLGANPSALTTDDIVALARGALEHATNESARDSVRFYPAGTTTRGPAFESAHFRLEPSFEVTRKEGDFDKGGFAQHGLMGHFLLAQDGSQTFGFNIVGPNGKVGMLVGDVKDGRIVTVHDIEIASKMQGIGSKVIAGLTADGPVKAADILSQAERFWRKHGAERDWEGNGKTSWEASRRSLDRKPRGDARTDPEHAAVSGVPGLDEAKTGGSVSDGRLSEADRKWLEENGLGKDDGLPMFASRRSAALFSRSTVSGVAQTVRDELNKTFNIPGKLSWWHTTVGTMYNLAERSPAFKKVFDSAQGFVDDVSHYATDAADLAPRLLPKLDTWRDVLKKPISAADNAAISKPIFEGTLSWSRDNQGRPILIDDKIRQADKFTADQKAKSLMLSGDLSEREHKMWQGMPLERYERNIESMYESKFLQPGIVWTDKELESLFHLSGAQIALYREFRSATDRSLDTMARSDMLRYAGKDAKPMRQAVMAAKNAQEASKLLRDYLNDLAKENPEREDLLISLQNGILDKEDRVAELKDRGYAPLSRFGKYKVYVEDTNGDSEYFGLFESVAEANKMAEKMRKAYPEMKVSLGTMSEEEFKMFSGITPETLELFGNALGLDSTGDEARDQAFQKYLKLTKNNRSAMKRLIHRKGIAGYSEDVGRVLASFIYSNSRNTAAGLNIGDLGEAVTEIPREQGELKDAAFRLMDYVKNPQEEAQALRGLLFAQYLGGSVASAFVNMTQPIAVSFPYLSQFGGARQSASELARAAKNMASRGFRFEADLAHALKMAEEDGTVSPQEIHQLQAQARGQSTLRSGDGTRAGDARAGVQNALSRLSLAWGKVFGVAEQANRRITFIAAYRIAKQQGIADPSAFAKKAVTETQFLYSKANKMEWGRGAIGGTLMTFKSYSIAYIELLHRMYTQGGPEGRKAALLALGVMMLMAGAGGLPFEDDLIDVADALAEKLGYNVSTKRARQEFLIDVFGEGVGQFIDKGVTGLPGVPIDVSGRLGLGNLIPGTGLLKSKTDHTRDLAEFAGPAGDLLMRGFSGASKMLGGDVSGGLLEVAPQAVRNFAKGADMAGTGMYRDAKGYKVIDTDGFEAGAKMIGFQPSSVADIQAANASNQQAKNFYALRAQEIRAKWASGIFENDPGAIQSARDEITDWNEKNPDQPMLIKMPSVWNKVREMRKSKDQRIADTAPRAMRARMKAEILERAAGG